MALYDEVYTHAGDEHTVKEWCKILKISYNTVKSRHARGANTFEKLFKIKPSQVRRIDKFTAEQGEDILRRVDLLELLFSDALRHKILALAKMESVANKTPYSVRDTLNELVRCGLLYMDKRMKELEVEQAKYDEWYRTNHPDGIKSANGWTVTSDHLEETQTHNAFKSITTQQDIDEIDALFR